MNFHWSNIFLSFIIFVNLKILDAKRLKHEVDEHPNTRSSRHKYFKLYPIQLKHYYKLLNKPYYKRHYLQSNKNKKHSVDEEPFVDLTRDEETVEATHNADVSKFSDDYIDISELARYAKAPADNKGISKHKPENKNILIDIHGDTHQVLKMLENIARRRQAYQQRSDTNSDTESSSTESKESGEGPKSIMKKKVPVRYVPKRFQVIKNNEGTPNDEDDKNYVSIETSSDFDTNDDKTQVNSESSTKESNTGGVIDELLYVQSPTRHIKTSDIDWRRRLPHFLPKRMHWSERDIWDLSNYWINGPRGKYPAPHKTPY